MKNKKLLMVLESVSLEELNSLVPLKNKLDGLEKKKKDLQKKLDAVAKQIDSLQGSVGKDATGKQPGSRKKVVKKKVKKAPKAKRKAATKVVKKRAKKRGVQPPLSTLIVEILKEKKRPVSVNDICEILLKEKKYKTKSKRFGNQIRVLLYRNDKGLFKKAGPGRFRLAGK